MSIIEFRASDGLVLTGELTFDTVPKIWEQGKHFIANTSVLRFDLRGIIRSDSAGLSLLIEWTREARRQHKRIEFVNMPKQMKAMARVSGLEEILKMTNQENK